MLHRALTSRRAAAAGGALALALLPAATARADQHVDLNLNYTCAFPDGIGDQTVAIAITATAPTTVVAGRPVTGIAVTASVTVPALLTFGLESLFGVSTIGGTGTGAAYIQAPQGEISKSVPFNIPRFTLPPDATFTASATGTVPPLTFTKPGTAVATVGDVSLTLVPENSSGGTTALGTITLPCKLNPGQDDVAARITVVSAPASSSPAHPSTSPARGGTSPAGSNSGSGSGSLSGSASAPGTSAKASSAAASKSAGAASKGPTTGAADSGSGSVQAPSTDPAGSTDPSGSFNATLTSTAASGGQSARGPLLIALVVLVLVGAGAGIFAHRRRGRSH